MVVDIDKRYIIELNDHFLALLALVIVLFQAIISQPDLTELKLEQAVR